MKRLNIIALIAIVVVTIAFSAWLFLRHRGLAPERQTACGNTTPKASASADAARMFFMR